MITEDYVSYEVAKLLKEKGFDEPCECAYSEEGQYLLSCYKGIAGGPWRIVMDGCAPAQYHLIDGEFIRKL